MDMSEIYWETNPWKGKGGVGEGKSSDSDTDLISEMKGGGEARWKEENLRRTQGKLQNKDWLLEESHSGQEWPGPSGSGMAPGQQ